jgi:hypothetical protein
LYRTFSLDPFLVLGIELFAYLPFYQMKQYTITPTNQTQSHTEPPLRRRNAGNEHGRRVRPRNLPGRVHSNDPSPTPGRDRHVQSPRRHFGLGSGVNGGRRGPNSNSRSSRYRRRCRCLLVFRNRQQQPPEQRLVVGEAKKPVPEIPQETATVHKGHSQNPRGLQIVSSKRTTNRPGNTHTINTNTTGNNTQRNQRRIFYRTTGTFVGTCHYYDRHRKERKQQQHQLVVRDCSSDGG